MSENHEMDAVHDDELADEALDDRGTKILPSVNPCNVLSVGCRADRS